MPGAFVRPVDLTSAVALVATKPDRSYSRITPYLFRALLRESTYLPDPAARTQIHSNIVSSFRRCCPRQWPGDRPTVLKKAAEDRIPTLLRDGIKNLRRLIRANQGHPEDLYKVLATTYGRRGRRRHELLRALKARDKYVMPEVLNLSSRPSDPKMNLPRIGEAVTELIKSQKAQKELGFDKAPTKNLKPMIEKENTWGRPLPLRRVANEHKKWYAMTLATILPPLPEDDWNRLKDLATGRVQWEGPIPRRRQAAVRDAMGDNGNRAIQDLFSGPEQVLDEPDSNNSSERLSNIKTNPHTLTPRYMKGLWAKIFARCPVMKWDTVKKQWDVQWGNVQRDKEIALDSHHPQDTSLFGDTTTVV